jgi:hypothetical protein
MIIRFPLPEIQRVMNWAMPSKIMLLALIKGAMDLSMKMGVPALILCECPIGRSYFQKETPFQNWIPFMELEQSISLGGVPVGVIFKGGGTREEIQERISFCLGEFLPKPCTFKEATARGLLFIKGLV